MALRLVRQTSDTPNITNKDDTVMTRYAYGGYNGVVKAFGSECAYTAENGIFKVLDGRIVIDGWEIDIDGEGKSLDFSKITGTQYHSVYVEINVLTENASISSTYLTGSYPEVEKGDDLTEIPNGTARLLLYNLIVVDGNIVDVEKRFEVISYLKTIEKYFLRETEWLREDLRKALEKLYNGESIVKKSNFFVGNGWIERKFVDGKITNVENLFVDNGVYLFEMQELGVFDDVNDNFEHNWTFVATIHKISENTAIKQVFNFIHIADTRSIEIVFNNNKFVVGTIYYKEGIHVETGATYKLRFKQIGDAG